MHKKLIINQQREEKNFKTHKQKKFIVTTRSSYLL